MGLPKRVKKLAQEANAIQEEYIKGPAEDAPKDDTVDKPKLVDSPADPPAAQDDWEKRFKGMKRKYDETVAPLREQLEKAMQQIQELTNALAKKNEEPEPVAVEEPASELTQAEIDEYGPELVSLVEKVSKGQLAKQVVALQQRLDGLENGQKEVQETNQMTAKQKFFRDLTARVKEATGQDWRQLNKHPNWLDWLGGEVAYTNKERQVFLREAQAAFDVDAVAQFFTDWYTQQGAAALNADPVESQIIPDDSGGGGGDDIPVGKTYTSVEVDQFYRDKTKGKYVTPEQQAEARRIELDILAAGREGRIIEVKKPHNTRPI